MLNAKLEGKKVTVVLAVGPDEYFQQMVDKFNEGVGRQITTRKVWDYVYRGDRRGVAERFLMMLVKENIGWALNNRGLGAEAGADAIIEDAWVIFEADHKTWHEFVGFARNKIVYEIVPEDQVGGDDDVYDYFPEFVWHLGQLEDELCDWWFHWRWSVFKYLNAKDPEFFKKYKMIFNNWYGEDPNDE